MKGILAKTAKIFVTNIIKIVSLLFAVSVIAFTLLNASPVDPVKQ